MVCFFKCDIYAQYLLPLIRMSTNSVSSYEIMAHTIIRYLFYLKKRKKSMTKYHQYTLCSLMIIFLSNASFHWYFVFIRMQDIAIAIWLKIILHLPAIADLYKNMIVLAKWCSTEEVFHCTFVSKNDCFYENSHDVICCC